MDVKMLKESIENKTFNSFPIILNASTDKFLAFQYLHQIKLAKNLECVVVDDLIPLIHALDDIFNSPQDDKLLYIYRCELFDFVDDNFMRLNNLVVVCDKIETKSKALFHSCVVDFPKLEPWQIQDFAYSVADGVDTRAIDWLIGICKSDLFRLSQELDKLSLFLVEERGFLFAAMVEDNAFGDMSNSTIFNLTSAIETKDLPKLRQLLVEIDNIDVDVMGLVTLLYRNFKNILSIQCVPNITSAALGVTDKQLWGIKQSCGYYTKSALYKIFDLLTSIDFKLKTGQMPIDIMRDYIILKILTS